MDSKTKKILWLTAGALLLLITRAMASTTFNAVLSKFLPSWEGFSSTPYWDYKQWTWGYGTRVPGSLNDRNKKPVGTITRAQAMTDALREVNNDYLYLKGLIRVPLSANQWAALLSFAYNLGTSNADNLVANINSGNLSALEHQWKQYINAGGQPLQTLIDRRNAEWKLYTNNI